jgi:hypothetical protein
MAFDGRQDAAATPDYLHFQLPFYRSSETMKRPTTRAGFSVSLIRPYKALSGAQSSSQWASAERGTLRYLASSSASTI